MIMAVLIKKMKNKLKVQSKKQEKAFASNSVGRREGENKKY